MPLDPSPAAPSPRPRTPWDACANGFHRSHRGPGIFPGLVLVAWGVLLLLREQGIIDPRLRAIEFWPVVLVGLGLSIAVRRRGGNLLVGLAVAALGAALLAQRLGYAVGVARLWPLLLIAAGIAVIWKSFTPRHVPRLANEQVSAHELQRSVTMGNLALVVDSQQFRGGALGVTMGEIRADLRRAAMATDEATLDLAVTMGGVELHVPTNWQIVSDLSPLMGVVEDRTDPRPDGAGVQRRLVLRGKITMGAVTVKN